MGFDAASHLFAWRPSDHADRCGSGVHRQNLLRSETTPAIYQRGGARVTSSLGQAISPARESRLFRHRPLLDKLVTPPASSASIPAPPPLPGAKAAPRSRSGWAARSGNRAQSQSEPAVEVLAACDFLRFRSE